MEEVEENRELEEQQGRWSEWWKTVRKEDHEKIVAVLEPHCVAVQTLDAAVAVKASKLPEVEFHRIADKVIGKERLADQAFLSWAKDGGEPELFVDPISGHIRLALAASELWPREEFGKYSRRWGLYHGALSGDAGVAGMVLERMGRRWEWMKAKGKRGWAAAGQELLTLGGGDAELLGRILKLGAHGGSKLVADMLALYGGEEMAAEVRADILATPFSAAELDPNLELSLVNHTGCVTNVLDYGKGLVATGGADCRLNLWHVNSGTVMRAFGGMLGYVMSSDVIPGKQIIATGCSDGTVRLWAVSSGAGKFGCLTGLYGHTSRVRAILAMNETTLVSASNELICWKLNQKHVWQEHNRYTSLPGKPGNQLLCAVKVGDNQFLTGGRDGVVRLWSLTPAIKAVAQHQLRNGAVGQMSLLPHGGVLVSTVRRSVWRLKDTTNLTLWDEVCRVPIIRVGPATPMAPACVGLPDGRVAVSSAPNVVALYRFTGGGETWDFVGSIHTQSEWVDGIVSLPDDRLVTVGCGETGSVYKLNKLSNHDRAVEWVRLAVLPSGHFVTGGKFTEIAVWKPPVRGKVPETESEWKLESTLTHLLDIATVGDGFATSTAALTDQPTGSVMVWSRARSGWGFIRMTTHSGDFVTLTGLPDGKRLLGAFYGMTVCWDVKTGKSLWACAPGGLSSAVLPGNRVALNLPTQLFIRNAENGHLLRSLPHVSSPTLPLIAGPHIVFQEGDNLVRVVHVDKAIAARDAVGVATAGGDGNGGGDGGDGGGDGGAEATQGGAGEGPDWEYELRIDAGAQLACTVMNRLAFAVKGNTILVWDVVAKTRLKSLLRVDDDIADVAWLPTSRQLAVLRAHRGWVVYEHLAYVEQLL